MLRDAFLVQGCQSRQFGLASSFSVEFLSDRVNPTHRIGSTAWQLWLGSTIRSSTSAGRLDPHERASLLPSRPSPPPSLHLSCDPWQELSWRQCSAAAHRAPVRLADELRKHLPWLSSKATCAFPKARPSIFAQGNQLQSLTPATGQAFFTCKTPARPRP